MKVVDRTPIETTITLTLEEIVWLSHVSRAYKKQLKEAGDDPLKMLTEPDTGIGVLEAIIHAGMKSSIERGREIAPGVAAAEKAVMDDPRASIVQGILDELVRVLEKRHDRTVENLEKDIRRLEARTN